MLKMYHSNQQVNSMTPSCETCGGPHSYYECQAAGGYTQDVYATTGNYNAGGNAYQPQAEPSVPIPHLFSSSKDVERDQETKIDWIPLSSTSSSFELPKRNPHQPQIPYPSRLNKEKLQDKSDIQYHKMLKVLLFDKEKLLGLTNTSLTENCSAALLNKLPEKLGDPEKFLIPCDFQELKNCMALADLGASINLMPLSVWKKLMLPELVPTCMTLELANRSLAYPNDIAEDVFVQVGKFTFPTDFIIVDYDVYHRDPLILRRPFLRMAHALVDVYDRFEEVLQIKKSNHWIGDSTTSLSDSSPSLIPFKTSDSLLVEFADELALFDPFPPGNEDDNFDPEDDLREIEYLLNRDPSTDFSPTTDIDIIDPNLERFTDEPAPVYSSPPGDDDDDDLFDLNSDNNEWKKLSYHDNYNDTHSENDKTKDSNTKSLIDELESSESSVLLPQLLDCDSTFHEELPEIDTLTSFPSENEDKVFNPCILVHGSTYFVTNLVTQDKTFKKKTLSEAPLILE
ncbi:reverse transcriptase domain-containing protein [Tanacetum coccineum]